MTFKYLSHLFRRRTEKYNVSPSLAAYTSQYNYIFYFHVVSYLIPVLNYFHRATYTELQAKKQKGKMKDPGREKGKREYSKMHSIK